MHRAAGLGDQLEGIVGLHLKELRTGGEASEPGRRGGAMGLQAGAAPVFAQNQPM